MDPLSIIALGLGGIGALSQANALESTGEANAAAQQAKLDLQKKYIETPTYDVYGGKTGYLPDPSSGEMAFRTQLTPAQQAIADAMLRASGSQAGALETDAAKRAALLPAELNKLDVPLQDAQGIVDRDLQRYEKATISPLLNQIQSQIARTSPVGMYSNAPDRYAQAFNSQVLPAVNFNRETKALDLQDTMKKRAQQNVNFYKTGETPSYSTLPAASNSTAVNASSQMTTPQTDTGTVTSGMPLSLLGNNLLALTQSDKTNDLLGQLIASNTRHLGDTGNFSVNTSSATV